MDEKLEALKSEEKNLRAFKLMWINRCGCED